MKVKVYECLTSSALPCLMCGKITEIGGYIPRGRGWVFICRTCCKTDLHTILQEIDRVAKLGLPVTIAQHRKAGTMNDYQQLAEQHCKAGHEHQAELYAFLAKCSTDDICNLFNSSAFNEICMGYLRLAVEELSTEGNLADDQAHAVLSRFAYFLDEKRAQEV